MFLFIFGILMKIDICASTNNNFAENSTSVLVPTEPNKKAIDKDDCNVGNFILVLLNGNIYYGRITLKSEEGCVVDCMEKKLKCCHWPL